MSFPLTKEQWYQERNDRTDRVVTGYEQFSIGVKVDPRIAEDYSLQVMTLLACNMAARWCPRITIELPESKTIIPNQKNKSFNKLVEKQLSQIDPYGKFEFKTIGENDVTQILIVGDYQKYQKNHVWANGQGWIGGCGLGSSPNLAYENLQNPVGPAIAACMANAELFSQAINQSPCENYEKWYDVFNLKESTKIPETQHFEVPLDFDLGTIHQVGCGAVGSSLDYLISLTDWKGKFTLIDHDIISYSNCNRSLSFTAYDAVDGTKKSVICGNLIQTSTRDVQSFPMTYSDYTARDEFSSEQPDLLLSLANEDNVWTTIQYNFPPLVFHAATTVNWAVNFGRHLPIDEWCMLCCYSDFLTHDSPLICETGVVDSDNGKEIIGTLPFLSPTAGVLILSEMAKLSHNQYPINDNFIELSMKPPFSYRISQKKPRKSCTCNQQSRKIYTELRGNSKFWKSVSMVKRMDDKK